MLFRSTILYYIFISFTRANSKHRLNVCRRLSAYESNATDPNECWYNPDVDSSAPDIINRYGYTYESYKVVSSDNYITTLFRIPNGQGDRLSKFREPIFLLHGFASSSNCMLDIGKNSLAFTLADAGYDVWLGNLRGTVYSIGHKSLSYTKSDYWNFSFHEMGKYDLKTNLEFINKVNHAPIIFIGHSIAASVYFVFEDYHREFSNNILKIAILIAPIVFLSNVQPIEESFSKFDNKLLTLSVLLGAAEKITPDISNIRSAMDGTCKTESSYLNICKNGFYLGFCHKSIHIPPHYVPLILSHHPSGFSLKTLHHLQQIAEEGVFQHYDYGVKQNYELYNNAFPREYDLKGSQTSIMIIYGENDWISTERDINILLKTIPKNIIVGKFKIPAINWQHMDYFYGRFVKQHFYALLLRQLDRIKEVDSVNTKSTTDRFDKISLSTIFPKN